MRKKTQQLLLFVLMALLPLTLSCYVAYTQLVSGWLREPAELLDVENVKSEYEWFHNRRRGLEGIMMSIRSVEWQLDETERLYGDDRQLWPLATREEYLQLSKIKTQQDLAYNMACATYQARWDNVFHSLVAPQDIPRGCQSLEE